MEMYDSYAEDQLNDPDPRDEDARQSYEDEQQARDEDMEADAESAQERADEIRQGIKEDGGVL